jgi:hypothetical protein
MFSSQVFRFVVVLAAAFFNDVTSALVSDTTTPEEVGLGKAKDYVILAKAGISTVPSSVITGDIGVSPIAATAMTGFSLTAHSTNVYSTSVQLAGTSKAYAANYAVPTPALLTTAVLNMEAAYTDAAGRDIVDTAKTNYGAGFQGDVPVLGIVFGGPHDHLPAGVYTFETDVTIDGILYFTGDEDDIFIIRVAGNLEQTGGARVQLDGGALAKNVFWQVAGHVKVGPSAHMEGIVLAATYVLFETEATIVGRIFAQTYVALQVATVTNPAD